MRKPFEVIAALTAEDSRLAKQALLLAEATANNVELFTGLRLAYDTLITFGVKKVPSHSGPDGQGLPWVAFEKLASQLQNRELTGHAARDAIELALTVATKNEWNGWYRLILLKDMGAGFSENTVNTVCEKNFTQFTIPVFTCQLAKDCLDEDGNMDESTMTGKKMLDTKLDGMRVLTVVYPTGKVDQFSRNGKELLNFEVVKKQISKVAHVFKVPTVLDGEIMSKSFQDLMKQARRKTDVQADDSVLNLFDIIPLSEFLNGLSTAIQKDRSMALHMWYDDHEASLSNVALLGYEVVDLDTDAGQARLKEINAAALLAKAEGIMIKDPNALYESKRSTNWQKLKPFIEESLTVVDIEEGKPDGNFVGTMGALVCEGIVDNKKVRVNVGGGFSIKLRAQIWADFTNKPVEWKQKVKTKWITHVEQPSGRNCIGDIVEVRADALTKSDDKDTWSMRFPRFKNFRGFTKGEKI